MKSVFVALVISLAAPSALACIGGHLKSLVLKDREIAQVNMSSDRVVVVDSRSELLYLNFTPEGDEAAELICGTPRATTEVCDHNHRLGVHLTDHPRGTLVVGVLVDGEREVEFKVTDFYRTRSIGGCGKTVEGN